MFKLVWTPTLTNDLATHIQGGFTARIVKLNFNFDGNGNFLWSIRLGNTGTPIYSGVAANLEDAKAAVLAKVPHLGKYARSEPVEPPL